MEIKTLDLRGEKEAKNEVRFDEMMRAGDWENTNWNFSEYLIVKLNIVFDNNYDYFTVQEKDSRIQYLLRRKKK